MPLYINTDRHLVAALCDSYAGNMTLKMVIVLTRGSNLKVLCFGSCCYVLYALLDF